MASHVSIMLKLQERGAITCPSKAPRLSSLGKYTNHPRCFLCYCTAVGPKGTGGLQWLQHRIRYSPYRHSPSRDEWCAVVDTCQLFLWSTVGNSYQLHCSTLPCLSNLFLGQRSLASLPTHARASSCRWPKLRVRLKTRQ